MFRVSIQSINKSKINRNNVKIDWDRYYQDQKDKSNNQRLNKVSDFAGNKVADTKYQMGGFGGWNPLNILNFRILLVWLGPITVE